jgi:PAS domain S-box-containing protein
MARPGSGPHLGRVTGVPDSTPEGTSDRFATGGSKPDGPARVYPLLADPGNEQLLLEWLDGVDEYEAVRDPTSVEEASFDLCVIDQGGLTANFEALDRRKRAEHPVLVPYLLLLPEDDPEFLRDERGQLPDTLVQSTVDEMLSLPVRQFELRWRIESLLRMRGRTRQLAQREQELRQKTRVVDESPVGIVITDPQAEDNPISYVNDAFVEMTGYSESDAIGRNCRFLQGAGTDPETVARLREGIDAEEPVSVTIRNYRNDGSDFWNHLEVTPVRDGTGEVINYVGFQQDVTGRRERQRQLQVIDRVLRHNLHNDLNVVAGMAEQIQTESGDQVSEYAQRIIDTGDALLETMDKEREITALLGDEPRRQDVNLASTLRSVVDLVDGEHPSATVELAVPDETVVRATSQIRNAIAELLRNALEHNDHETPHVQVTVSDEAGDVAVRITDNGPGIPEMERDILLGNEEETPLYHGSGLGLWLVQLTVRRSNGMVEFPSNEPSGGVVNLYLKDAETA